MHLDHFRDLKPGQRVVIACTSTGAGAEDADHTHPEGSIGLVTSNHFLSSGQGRQVTLLIGHGESQIDNRWDETDDLDLLSVAEPRILLTLSQIRDLYMAGMRDSGLADALVDIVNEGVALFDDEHIPFGTPEAIIEAAAIRDGLAEIARL